MEEVRALFNAPDTSNRLGIRDRAMLHLCFCGGAARFGTRGGSRWGMCASNEHRAFAFSEKDEENDAFRSGRKLLSIFVPGWRFEERRRYPSYL